MTTAAVRVPAAGGSALRRLLDDGREALIAEERALLQRATSLLEEIAPQACTRLDMTHGSQVDLCDVASRPYTLAHMLTHAHTHTHSPWTVQMAELPLLRDAVANLDDVFLVVVVGEFNSGKSTVINALLGQRFLEDGILPTTNEISVLK